MNEVDKKLLFGFWFLPLSFLMNFIVQFRFTCLFLPTVSIFLSIHSVFCLKLLLRKFNYFLVVCYNCKSFLKCSWISFVCLKMNSEIVPPKLAGRDEKLIARLGSQSVWVILRSDRMHIISIIYVIISAFTSLLSALTKLFNRAAVLRVENESWSRTVSFLISGRDQHITER